MDRRILADLDIPIRRRLRFRIPVGAFAGSPRFIFWRILADLDVPVRWHGALARRPGFVHRGVLADVDIPVGRRL